jgi:hypothetical protein
VQETHHTTHIDCLDFQYFGMADLPNLLWSANTSLQSCSVRE